MSELTVEGLHAYLNDLLKNVIGDRGHLSILDVGCGTGAWLNRMRDRGFDRMVGIDRILPEHFEGADLRRFDIGNDTPRDLGRFGVVTCIEVIEHMENPGRLLDLLRQTLSPEGVAIITTPNVESLRARLRALVTGKIPSFDERGDPTHLHPILHDSLKKMLIARAMYIAGVHQYPPDPSMSMMYGKGVRRLANILRAVLRDDLYGDNIIYVVRPVKEK